MGLAVGFLAEGLREINGHALCLSSHGQVAWLGFPEPKSENAVALDIVQEVLSLAGRTPRFLPHLPCHLLHPCTLHTLPLQLVKLVQLRNFLLASLLLCSMFFCFVFIFSRFILPALL